jgi:Helix-turn-helix domain
VKRLSDQTLYEILEVPPGAAGSEVESAYERVKALYAPGSLATYTLMSPDEAALLTSRIEEAKRTLLDPDARARYDASLSAREEDARPGPGAAARPLPFGPLPPVIPALQPARQPAPPVAPASPVAQPVILLAAATEAAGPVAAAPRPILLMREIVPTPTPPPAEATPPPAEAPTPPAEAPTPPPEVLQPEGSVWTGEALRKVREARGISIPQIAERTKVTRHHVENIEGDRYGALPAPVYLRGILFSLARELRLDGQRVARSYLDRAAAALGASGSHSR